MREKLLFNTGEYYLALPSGEYARGACIREETRPGKEVTLTFCLVKGGYGKPYYEPIGDGIIIRISFDEWLEEDASSNKFREGVFVKLCRIGKNGNADVLLESGVREDMLTNSLSSDDKAKFMAATDAVIVLSMRAMQKNKETKLTDASEESLKLSALGYMLEIVRGARLAREERERRELRR